MPITPKTASMCWARVRATWADTEGMGEPFETGTEVLRDPYVSRLRVFAKCFVPLFQAPAWPDQFSLSASEAGEMRENAGMTDAEIERETLTWDGFGEATRDLARSILDSGFMPEVVVAIARGGLLPAGAIAYGLGAKNCGAINVEFYTGIGTVLDAPEVLPPELDMAYLDGRRVLLVDDVADSGRTLALAVQLLKDKGADVRSVTIYTKPSTIIQPDFAWKDTDLWINFPWSFRGTVREEDLGLAPSA